MEKGLVSRGNVPATADRVTGQQRVVTFRGETLSELLRIALIECHHVGFVQAADRSRIAIGCLLRNGWVNQKPTAENAKE
jgi:hypothetical protein